MRRRHLLRSSAASRARLSGRLAAPALVIVGLLGGSGAGCSDAGPPDEAEADTGASPWSPPDGSADDDVTDFGDDGGDVATPAAPFAVLAFDVEANAADLDRLHADPRALVEIPVGVTVDHRHYEGATLEVHGGYARTLPKLSYRVEFPYATPWMTHLFSTQLEAHRRVVLQASWIDPTWLRNAITMDAERLLGGIAPRVQFVTLSFNGVYHGLYAAIERVDPVFLSRHGLDDDGLLLKAENHKANWAVRDNPLDGFDVAYNEDAPTADLGTLLHKVSDTPATYEDFQREIRPWLSLEDYARWQMVHTLANDRDTFNKNYYLYRDWEHDAPFRVFPWDADATWGQSWDGTPAPVDATAWYGVDTFAPRLFGIAGYREPYLAQYRAVVSSGELQAQIRDNIAERAARIATFAREDLDAWDRGRDFDAEVQLLLDAVDTRFATMQQALAEGSGP